MPSPVASIQYLGHVKVESWFKSFSLLLSAIAKQQKNATVRADIFVHNSMFANFKLICEHSMFLLNTYISRHDFGKYLLTFLKY